MPTLKDLLMFKLKNLATGMKTYLPEQQMATNNDDLSIDLTVSKFVEDFLTKDLFDTFFERMHIDITKLIQWVLNADNDALSTIKKRCPNKLDEISNALLTLFNDFYKTKILQPWQDSFSLVNSNVSEIKSMRDGLKDIINKTTPIC